MRLPWGPPRAVSAILPALGGAVLQVHRVADLAFGIGDHGPGEGRDFLGAQACLDRQQEHGCIAPRVACGFQVPQEGGFLFGVENLCLFALHGSIQGVSETAHRQNSLIGYYAYQWGRSSSQDGTQLRINARLTGKLPLPMSEGSDGPDKSQATAGRLDMPAVYGERDRLTRDDIRNPISNHESY